MNSQFLMLTFLFILLQAKATVILDSSSNQTCPGDTVTYTCVTDTGYLVWRENNKAQLLFTIDYHPTQQLDIFTVNLTSISGMVIVSTATFNNVLLEHNGTALSCFDHAIINLANMSNRTLTISGPPSPPLNITITTSSTLSSVNISWVAPLDTPLCVHSYTVTVNNSCNSSQVMVYNTTDNMSSLNITNLTSDEYSVTVAGRDGAGQLGQESKEEIYCHQLCIVSNIKYDTVKREKSMYGVLIQWKIFNKPDSRDTEACSCATEALQVQFLITHNVSLEPLTIEINRTNVTLYGVTPGETYYVNILPLCNGLSKERYMCFTMPQDYENNGEESCSPVLINNAEKLIITEGHIASVAAFVILVLVIIGYVILYISTKSIVPSTEDITSTAVISSENTHNLLTQSSDKETHNKHTFSECVNEDAKQSVRSSLPMYDCLYK